MEERGGIKKLIYYSSPPHALSMSCFLSSLWARIAFLCSIKCCSPSCTQNVAQQRRYTAYSFLVSGQSSFQNFCGQYLSIYVTPRTTMKGVFLQSTSTVLQFVDCGHVLHLLTVLERKGNQTANRWAAYLVAKALVLQGLAKDPAHNNVSGLGPLHGGV